MRRMTGAIVEGRDRHLTISIPRYGTMSPELGPQGDRLVAAAGMRYLRPDCCRLELLWLDRAPPKRHLLLCEDVQFSRVGSSVPRFPCR